MDGLPVGGLCRRPYLISGLGAKRHSPGRKHAWHHGKWIRSYHPEGMGLKVPNHFSKYHSHTSWRISSLRVRVGAAWRQCDWWEVGFKPGQLGFCYCLWEPERMRLAWRNPCHCGNLPQRARFRLFVSGKLPKPCLIGALQANTTPDGVGAPLKIPSFSGSLDCVEVMLGGLHWSPDRILGLPWE